MPVRTACGACGPNIFQKIRSQLLGSSLKARTAFLNFPCPGFRATRKVGRIEVKETSMRKFHTALMAGAVVVGLGAVAGLAAFAPSLLGRDSTSHELTLQLPGGGTETIAYSGKTAPKVTFHTERFAAFWPAPAYDWMLPSFVAFDPFVADMNTHLNMLAPPLLPAVPDQPLGAAALGKLPAGTSYSMVSETFGDGACTRFTQITKAAGGAKPKIVTQTSGNCGNAENKAATAQPVKADKLRTAAKPAATQNM
jgi:hypothetical protein